MAKRRYHKRPKQPADFIHPVYGNITAQFPNLVVVESRACYVITGTAMQRGVRAAREAAKPRKPAGEA